MLTVACVVWGLGGAGTCHSGARVLALSGPLCSPVSPPRQQLGSARLISWAGPGLASSSPADGGSSSCAEADSWQLGQLQVTSTTLHTLTLLILLHPQSCELAGHRG